MRHLKVLLWMLFVLVIASCSEPKPPPPPSIQTKSPTDEVQELIQENKYEEAAVLLQKVVDENPEKIEYLIDLGALYVRVGQKNKAIEIYHHALLIDPDNPRILSALAFVHLFNGDTDKSREYFEQVLSQNPHHIDALVGLGYIASLSGNQDKAEQYYQKALKLDPENLNALIYLGNLRIQEKRYKEASVIFEKLNETYPNNPDILEGLQTSQEAHISPQDQPEPPPEQMPAEPLDERTQKGLSLFKEGHFGESQEILEAILKEHPNSAEALISLGDMAYIEGEEAEAEWLYLEALDTGHEEVWAHFRLAELKLDQKRYLEAQSDYEAILAKDPKNAEAKKGRLLAKERPRIDAAETMEKNYQDKEAAQEYEALLKSSPTNIEYIMHLAEIYNRVGKKQEALHLYQFAANLNPDEDYIQIALGYSYLGNDDLQKAQEVFQSVLDRSPKNVEAITGLGRVAATQKNTSLAESDYEKALEIDPNNQTTLQFLAEIRIEQKRFLEAEEIYAKLAKEHPSEKYYESSRRHAHDKEAIDLAHELEVAKDYDGALEIYERLIAASPKDPEYYTLLGNAYVGKKEYDTAVDAYLIALELKPDDKELYKAIAFTFLYKAIDFDWNEGNLDWSCKWPFVTCAIKENAEASLLYFEEALNIDPDDAEAYAGLGRIAAIYDQQNLAASYYDVSLALSENNNTALSNWASLLTVQQSYFSANDIYSYQFSKTPDDHDLKGLYLDTWRRSHPNLIFGIYYHEEDEWDHIVHKPAAVLQDYGTYLEGVMPYDDAITFSARIAESHYLLKTLIDPDLQYAFDIQRMAAGFNVIYSPHLTLYGRFGLTYSHKYHEPLQEIQRKWLILPTCGLIYTECRHTINARVIAEDNIVEQNFTKGLAKLFAGYGIFGSYEYDFGKRRLFGFQASNMWFNDWDHNQRQGGATWLQLTPPKFWENLCFRYQFNFGRFNKLTEDYYTYQAQTTHTCIIEWSNSWLDGDIYAFFGATHSWQRSFESGQILVVVPTSTFHFVNRRINSVYGNLQYRATDCLRFSFDGDYSKETYDYTMWTLKLSLDWSF